jgi:regulatory protein
MEQDGYAKLVRFCLYRERCVKEVLEKMSETDLPPEKFASIIRKLQEDGYLDESRYARLFVQDKFRLKKWGRKKIQHELRLKKIPAAVIQEKLYEIDDEAYMQTLRDLAEKKQKELAKEKNPLAKQAKVIRFLVGKGYEYDLVKDAVK